MQQRNKSTDATPNGLPSRAPSNPFAEGRSLGKLPSRFSIGLRQARPLGFGFCGKGEDRDVLHEEGAKTSRIPRSSPLCRAFVGMTRTIKKSVLHVWDLYVYLRATKEL